MDNLPMSAYNGDSLPMVMTVQELAEYLGIGKNKAYSLLREGSIKGFRIGPVWRVSKEAVDMYIRIMSGMG